MIDSPPPARSAWVRAALDRYEAPLTRYAARITGDLDAARDVVQETFLRLCAENPAELDHRLAPWLFAVCRRRALDVRRKEKRMRPLTDTAEQARESRDPAPSAAAERQDTSRQVLAVLGTLPENQQEVIRLRFQNGLSYKEISAVTSLTVGNVGFLIHTALQTLRNTLKAELGPAADGQRSRR